MFDFVPTLILFFVNTGYNTDGFDGDGSTENAFEIRYFIYVPFLTTSYAQGAAPYDFGDWNHAYAKKSSNSKSVYWYNTDSGGSQLNGSASYHYMGF